LAGAWIHCFTRPLSSFAHPVPFWGNPLTHLKTDATQRSVFHNEMCHVEPKRGRVILSCLANATQRMLPRKRVTLTRKVAECHAPGPWWPPLRGTIPMCAPQPRSRS
jgi:hypothetical protein